MERGTIALVGAIALTSCALPGGGRTFVVSGDPAYDAFFEDVERMEQVEQRWADARVSAHGALRSALGLPPDVSDLIVLQAIRQRAAVDPSVTRALEDATTKDRKRAQIVRAASRPLAQLSEQGRALVAHVEEASKKSGTISPSLQVRLREDLEVANRRIERARRTADREAIEADAFVELAGLVALRAP